MVPFRYLHIVYLRTLERYLQEFDYFVSTVCNSLQRNPDSGLFILAI